MSHSALSPSNGQLDVLRKVFEHSQDAVAILGLDGSAIDLNLAYRHLLGVSEKRELESLPVVTLLGHLYEDVLRAAIAPAAA